MRRMLQRTVILATILLVSASALAFDGNCYYRLTDMASVTTTGYYYDSNGQIVYVNPHTTYYYYYTKFCDYGGPGDYEGGTGSSVILRPFVTLFSVDTTNPSDPRLIVDVASDPNAPATSLSLTIGGYQYQTLPIGWDGTYHMEFPAVGWYGDGTVNFSVRACNANNQCGSAGASFTRYTPPHAEASTDVHVNWLEGDEFRYATYGHVYRQWYMTTEFNYIEELAYNSARQLRGGYVTLSWPSDAVAVSFDAAIDAYGIRQESHWLNPCASPLSCTKCGTKCHHDMSTYGIMVSARDRIWNLVKQSSFEPMNIWSGGDSLEVNIP